MTTDNRTNEQLSGISGQFTDAQVEATAKAIADCHNPGMFEKYPENWRVEARAALAAADAHLPSVEMIAEMLYDEFATRTDLSMVECERAACAVRSLFGEVAGDE